MIPLRPATRIPLTAFVSLVALVTLPPIAGCPAGDAPPLPPPEPDVTADGPLAAYCGDPSWEATATPGVVDELAGDYLGITTQQYSMLPEGSAVSMKLIPPHPFHVTAIRAAFSGGGGDIRLRLTDSWGRSYPDIDGVEDGDLTEPIEVEIDDPDPDEWLEFDVSDRELFLLPAEHYHLVYEIVDDGGPNAAIETVVEGEYSRALILVPGESMPYGVDGNVRLQLAGEFVCAWEDGDRWFAKDEGQPFHEDSSSRVAVTDLDGDGHDDLVIHSGGPKAYLGDGSGQFAAPSFEPFPDRGNYSMLVFADVDNDGDVDAFANSYIGADDDGDGVTKGEGDCNDADPDVRPTKAELASNGIDDNCDGLTDDGLDTSDHDGDGVTAADGDCHDFDATVSPAAAEIPDNHRDDDCDGVADDGTDTSDLDFDGATIAGGDCDDTNNAIYPNRTDGVNNGIDDDCDGVVDDGFDTSDADGDGVTVADGDCDDTRAEVFPGNAEARDSMDNDCDGAVDEDFGNRMLRNDGTGLFTVIDDAGVETVDPSTAAGFADADGDGALDLYWGNWLELYPNDPAVQDCYVTGHGDGTFTDALDDAGLRIPNARSVYGVMWNDWNNDGWPDLYVANYHLYANQQFANQGDGTFVDVAEDIGMAYDDIPGPYDHLAGGHSYGGDFGDVDNDGDMDFFLCNLAHPRVQPWSDPSMFGINQGAPDYLYVNQREEYGFPYDEGDVNAQFADFDNDMDVDIAIAALYTGHYAKVLRNDGEDGFTDVTYQTGVHVHDSVSVTWSDVDEDGDLDLFVADRQGAPYVHLFVNQVGQDRHWIELDLRGTATNRDAIGARVTLTAGGVTQLREVKGGEGHSNTQSSRIVHFGLGDETAIESCTVRWVGGATETITGLEVDGRYVVEEGSGAGVRR